MTFLLQTRTIRILFTLLSLAMSVSSIPSFAAEELDIFDQFGIEVFEIDPAKQKEMEAQREQERQDALPSYINLETLEMDKALDAVDLELPTEPTWQAIEQEIELKSFESRACCLRATRITRYNVEQQCHDRGHQIWHIESKPVQYQSKEVIKTHKLCKVYHNEESKQEYQEIYRQRQEDSANMNIDILPEFYACRARSLAKCFDPTGDNAIFANSL